jgi:hypothetical protein
MAEADRDKRLKAVSRRAFAHKAACSRMGPLATCCSYPLEGGLGRALSGGEMRGDAPQQLALWPFGLLLSVLLIDATSSTTTALIGLLAVFGK